MQSSSGSRTARVVAVGRAVGVGGERDRHVARLLPAGDQLAVRAARRLRPAGTWAPSPGMLVHAGLRMQAVDAALRRSLQRSGARTVVVVGAGYDTRAYRLRELRGCRVIEVDHPATQAAKRRNLPPLAEAVADLVLAGADLGVDDLDEVLARVGHDATAPTVWLWEAVVPYLPSAAVDATLAVLAGRSAPGSELLVTTVTEAWLDPAPVGRALQPVARALMRAIGEPVLLAESDAAVAARLRRAGFEDRGATGPRRWAADAGVRVVGPFMDERLHVAEWTGA